MSQIMLYYKETAFLLLLGFAVGRLILRCRKVHAAGWDYDRLWDTESRLDLCFASLAMLFLLYYITTMDIQENMNYVTTTRHPRAEVALGYLRVDLLAWLFMAVVAGRGYLILRRRVVPLLLWDGLAFGGVSCFLAYLSWTKILVILLATIVLLQDILVSDFVVFERKNTTHAKAEIASVVETRYRSGAGNDLRLFFPFAGPYVISEFASYLDYRGVSVQGAVGESRARNSVLLATRAMTRDGYCVEGLEWKCHAASGPAPGDLVIVLPDDGASAEEASVYREQGELLFSYEPTPLIPHWLHSLFASFHMATTRLWPHETIPDRWMDGSVTTWK